MKQVSRFVRRWWWAFVAVAAGIFVLVWRLLAIRQPKADPEPSPVPALADRARVEVERIQLEGEVEKAKVSAQAEVQKAELERIEEMGKSDPREARRLLSLWLTRNL